MNAYTTPLEMRTLIDQGKISIEHLREFKLDFQKLYIDDPQIKLLNYSEVAGEVGGAWENCGCDEIVADIKKMFKKYYGREFNKSTDDPILFKCLECFSEHNGICEECNGYYVIYTDDCDFHCARD